MASVQEITCKCGCGRKRLVRTADVKRGWGKFFDKSCKARWQEKRTGQYAEFKNRVYNNDIGYEDGSWDAHKNSF